MCAGCDKKLRSSANFEMFCNITVITMDKQSKLDLQELNETPVNLSSLAVNNINYLIIWWVDVQFSMCHVTIWV